MARLSNAELTRIIEHEGPQVLSAPLADDLRLILAQILVESGGDQLAVSPVGAVGLMQIMPGTARYLRIAEELLFDPIVNVRAGMRYLQEQYDHLAEIPDQASRILFALASYNGGRGWVNAALALARQAEGLPYRLSQCETEGVWQNWGIAAPMLHQARSASGKRPDAAQMITYAARIWITWWRLCREARA